MDKLMSYNWPGNVRELQNVLKRRIVAGNWDEVVDELSIRRSSADFSTPTDLVSGGFPMIDDLIDFDGENPPDLSSFSLKEVRKKALDRVEKAVITHVLDQTGWNRTKASTILKISYKTLLYKIRDLNIEPPMNLP